MEISVEIDSFTPCLIKTSTGQVLKTEYRKADRHELTALKKAGWNFNWNHESLKSTDIFLLKVENDKRIQGLVALTKFERDRAVFINLVESAPHNIGKSKEYEGVGGHLFAIAANESVKSGYGGFLFLDAKNAELVKYYHEKLGATLLGMPHPFRMFIDEDSAQIIL